MQQSRDGPGELAAENAALRQRVAALEAELARLRKQAQDRPADSLLARALNQLPTGVLIAAAPSGRLIMQNREADRLLHHPLLPGSDYTDYWQYSAFHPDGSPYRPEEYPLARALLSASAIPFEDVAYRRGDGTLTTLAVSAAPILDEAGQIVAVAGTFHDISHQRRLEAALRENEEWLRLAFDAAELGTWQHDLRSNRVQFDARAQRQYGSAQPNLSIEEVLALVHPDDVESIHETARQMLDPASNGRGTIEYRVIHPDGAVHWLAVQVRVRFAGTGATRRPALFVGASHDITARKAAEAALIQSEALYSTIVRNLPDAAILVVEQNLRYVLAEGPALALLGLSRDQVEGHTPAEVLDANMAALVEERYRRALAGEELTVECAYGDRTLWTRYVPLRDDGGRVQGAMELAFDITPRKALEGQLLQVQKMESIGHLAGGIAHDFNNLLTAIGGYADLAMAELPPKSTIHSDLVEIQHAVDRASALTSQILAFARRQRLTMRPLDLNELVANLEKLLRRLINENIQLVTQLAPSLAPVMADPGQIEQVLVNLAVNARDAMPDGGTLTIMTTNIAMDTRYAHLELPAGSYVVLTVRDTGIGIAPQARPHLFEPFFTTKSPGQGTGLGLATCYGIVKQHNGAIWIDSELGHGTAVKVYLPRSGRGTADQAQGDPAIVLARGTETVLLAEDEPTVRALAARVLRACGYTVLEANDGEEAARVAATYAPRPIHLLLSDVVMPRLGGLATAERVRAVYPRIRVIFMSGYTGISRPPEFTGDAPLVRKPFSPAELAREVRAMLDT
jgi:two-component system cell cycle sensor histidine kinase/response regulator CckA